MRKPKTRKWRIQRARAAGLIGGPARTAALSPERRSEIARAAAQARWGKR